MASSASCEAAAEGVSPSASTPRRRREPLISSVAVVMRFFPWPARTAAHSRFYYRLRLRGRRISTSHPSIHLVVLCFLLQSRNLDAMNGVLKIDHHLLSLIRKRGPKPPAQCLVGTMLTDQAIRYRVQVPTPVLRARNLPLEMSVVAALEATNMLATSVQPVLVVMVASSAATVEMLTT